MITLLQIQGKEEWITQSDKLLIISVWGILAIISANILLHVWKGEDKEEGGHGLTLLSYFGAWTFGTLMAPVITPLALLGWMGTITPKDAKGKILSVYNGVKEATIGHWRLGRAKQAPPTFTTSTNSGILVHPNPPSTSTIGGGPYINDMMNVQPYHSHSMVSHPIPNMSRGTRSGPNRMTRLSNGSYGKSGAPSWYVPSPALKAKKASK